MELLHFSLKRWLERSKDLTSFKCKIVFLLVSLNSFYLYLFTNSVNLSVFEYVCVCVCACVCVCVCVWVGACVCVSVCVCIYTYIQILIYIYTFMKEYSHLKCIFSEPPILSFRRNKNLRNWLVYSCLTKTTPNTHFTPGHSTPCSSKRDKGCKLCPAMSNTNSITNKLTVHGGPLDYQIKYEVTKWHELKPKGLC